MTTQVGRPVLPFTPEPPASPMPDEFAPGLRVQRFTDHAVSGPLAAGSPPDDEEMLIADARASLSPAQMVERKLSALLKGNPLPVSHVRMARLPRSRGYA